ncbi:MAG: glutamate--tRNA ligase [Alphaproteobacteria bacterium]|nr:glutamate--tRNA ligase [Alphaproteobacteria bacterium]
MSCKVRFAPSPTGFMHIGNARIAIVNYLFCKKNNGKFLFRVDDTDAIRSKKEYEDAIKADLEWLNIRYDETFRQSDRLSRYQDVLDILAAKGLAYRCFETPEELEYKRKLAISKGNPPVYDRSALKLTSNEIAKLDAENVPSYWRFKLPEKSISWHDFVLGDISYDLRSVSDPVIMKADGTFLYTFSSVVDDFDSGITHIIRGQDHVTNTAMQIAMFDEISDGKYHVNFAHLSLLVNKDGSQFSKRLGSSNLRDIREQGIDPMAIFDLLATLGTSMDTKPFTKLDDLIEYFDIEKFSSNSPKFDIEDIYKINRKILRSKSYVEVSHLGLSEAAYELVKDNITSYNDFAEWRTVLSSSYKSAFSPTAEDMEALKLFSEKLGTLNNPTEDEVKEAFNHVGKTLGISGKGLYHPIRQALTGMDQGPNLTSIIKLLGKAETLRRIQLVLR